MHANHVPKIIDIGREGVKRPAGPVLELGHGLVPASDGHLARGTIPGIVLAREPEVDEVVPYGTGCARRVFGVAFPVSCFVLDSRMEHIRIHGAGVVHDVRRLTVPGDCERT